MNTNPFDRQQKGTRLNPEDLGEITSVPDTMEEDLKKIKNLIPQENETSTEEGFNKMMNILNQTPPKMATPVVGKQPVNKVVEEPATGSAFAKKKATKAAPKDPKENIPATTQSEVSETPEKELTLSEKMGLNYPDEDILPIIDSLMTKGYASETITIRNQPITFKVTYSWEEQEIIKRLDKQINNGEVNLRQTGSYFYDLYCLAASLERFGANYFPPVDSADDETLQKSFDERIKFLSGLASPFITILVQKRIEFMKKIQFLTDNINKFIKAF